MAYTIQEQLIIKKKKINDFKQKLERLEQEVKELEKKQRETEITDFIKSIAEAGFSFDDIRTLIAKEKTPVSNQQPTSTISNSSFSEQKTNDGEGNIVE